MIASYILWGLGAIFIVLSFIHHNEERAEDLVAGVAAIVFGIFLAWLGK